jgi:hypothetical protein
LWFGVAIVLLIGVAVIAHLAGGELAETMRRLHGR